MPKSKRNIIPTFARNPKHVAAELALLSKEPGKFDYLTLGYDEQRPEVYLFRNGAKLIRTGLTKWRIHGYASDGKDIESALLEMKAANYLRLAVAAMKEVEVVGQTAKEFQLTYLGLIGKYSNGQTNPTTYHATSGCKNCKCADCDNV